MSEACKASLSYLVITVDSIISRARSALNEISRFWRSKITVLIVQWRCAATAL